MLTCTIVTKVFNYEPEWTSGCQSDPDDYICKELQESKESVNIDQIEDSTLKVLLNIILTNPKVERISIERNHIYNKWPDEWGATRTIKKLTCEKKSAHENLSEVKIVVDNQTSIETYTRDGIPIESKDIFFQKIKDSVTGQMRLTILFYERTRE